MKKYNFLVLTDHSGHSHHNSLYALMSTLVKHKQCNSLHIASRGNKQNGTFFWENAQGDLYGTEVQEKLDFDATGLQFTSNQTLLDLANFDIIIMRLPRPISDDFLNVLAEKVAKNNTIIINHPKGIIETSTKAFLLNFPAICPPMRLCKSAAAITEMAAKFPIVIKPLCEYGGKGIVKIVNNQVEDGLKKYSLEDYLNENLEMIVSEGVLAMKFLKNVAEGDKRILVVNGQILASSLRLPARDSWLCNIAQGGRSVPSTVDKEEEEIIAQIMPKLLEKGIVMFGADTLVNDEGQRVLSEINTLSIGGFPQAEIQTGLPVVQMAVDGLFNYINTLCRG